jgi:hypothetical protein
MQHPSPRYIPPNTEGVAWSTPMDRISAWIDERPYRFQLTLLVHTAVFTGAILIAVARF